MILFLASLAAAETPADATCTLDDQGALVVETAATPPTKPAPTRVWAHSDPVKTAPAQDETCDPADFTANCGTFVAPDGKMVVEAGDDKALFVCDVPRSGVPADYPADWCEGAIEDALYSGDASESSYYAVCVDSAEGSFRSGVFHSSGADRFDTHLGYLEPYVPVVVVVRHDDPVQITVSGEVAKPEARALGHDPSADSREATGTPANYSTLIAAPRTPGTPFDVKVEQMDGSGKVAGSTEVELVPLNSYHGAFRMGVGFGMSLPERASFSTGNEGQLVATSTRFSGPELIVGFAPFFKPRAYDPSVGVVSLGAHCPKEPILGAKSDGTDRCERSHLPFLSRFHPYLGLGVLKASEDDTKVVPVDLLTSGHVGVEFALSPNTSIAVVGSAWRGQRPQAGLSSGDSVTDLQSQLVSDPRFGASVVVNFHPQQWVRAQTLGKPQKNFSDVLDSRSVDTEKQLKELKEQAEAQQKKIEENEKAAKEATDAAKKAQEAADAAGKKPEPKPENPTPTPGSGGTP